MRRILTASLAMMSILATTAAAQVSGPVKGHPQNGAGPRPATGRPVQAPTRPTPSVPLPASQHRGTIQPGGKGMSKPTTLGQNSGHNEQSIAKGNSSQFSGAKGSTQSQTATKRQTKDAAGGSPANPSVVNNNNNNTNININFDNFGVGSSLWGGWAAWSGPAFWSGFGWGGWGLPAYLPFALWSPIHEPIVFIP
jgi:hypothetical protein